jgi:hypothetical protein
MNTPHELLQGVFEDAAARGADQLQQDRAAKAAECDQRTKDLKDAEDWETAGMEANKRLTAEGNRISEELRKAETARNRALIDNPAASAVLRAKTASELLLAEYSISAAHRHLVEHEMNERRISVAEKRVAHRAALAELAQLDAQLAVLRLRDALAPLSAGEGRIAVSSERTEALIQAAGHATNEHL